MAITRNDIVEQLVPGLNTIVGTSYDMYPPQWKGCFTEETTERAFEEELMRSGLQDASKKGEGAPINYDEGKEGWVARYRPEVYALGFRITKEAIDDNLYEKDAKFMSQELGSSLRNTKEINAANIFNRAFNSAFKGGDLKELCATDHPLTRGGTFSNELETAADLSEAALEQMFIDIQTQFVTESGRKAMVLPKKMVIPPQLQFEAARILKSELRVSSADNDINALRAAGHYGEPIVNQYLTDPDAYFVITNVPHGLKYFERHGLEKDMTQDFDTGDYKYKAMERYTFGWTDPRGIFGSPGAA